MPQESKPEQVRTAVQEARQEVAPAHRPWYYLSRTAKSLLLIYSVVLLLFTVLAWWVHAYPVNQVDLLITREFQENSAPWLHLLMAGVSYPDGTLLLPALVALAAVIFWVLGLRLEARGGTLHRERDPRCPAQTPGGPSATGHWTGRDV